MKKISVTELLKANLLIAFVIFNSYQVFGQEVENLNVLDNWINWSDGKNMLRLHLNQQAFSYFDQRDSEINNIKTKTDVVNRQKKIKDVLWQTVGPFPEKTALNTKVTGTIKKAGYKIEKIIYESLPGFYVTGCIYLPDGKGKKPAILFTSGHTMDAFRNKSYQTMILNLVKKGFIVLAIDPISQGERIQLYDPDKKISLLGAGAITREHSYLGTQTLISGTSIARYFIWDGIRGIDYLLTRDEVDPQRLGVTGQSGGGTQAAYLYAFDERIKAGAIVNYITGFRRLLESIGPQDAEQNFYHGVLKGITHADLLEVRAPNSVMICAGTRDFFSIQGARETYSEVKNMYNILEAGSKVELVEDDYGHGYTIKFRENICAFFQEHLDIPGNPKDEEVMLSDLSELTVTKTGNTTTAFENAETVSSINSKESKKLVDNLNISRKNIHAHLDNIHAKAQNLSGYIPPDVVTESVFRGRYQRDGYSVEMYALAGEGKCVIPLLLFVPGKGSLFPTVIYIHPHGKNADSQTGGKIEQLVNAGYIVAVPDVIGTGETEGNSSVAMLIGRSLVGIQAGDVVRVANFLKQRNDVDAKKIGGIAFGKICPTLLHAAVMDESIQTISLIDPLISYQSIVENKLFNDELSNYIVAGSLTSYDLPDLIGYLSPRKVALAGIRDQMGQLITKSLEESGLSFPKSAYSAKQSSNHFKVFPESESVSFLLKWCFE
ncbi:Putative Hypothetical protein [Petrimonas sp. IBARAKI]|nr:Putative Hypothetical protein [Petrimonas sp. IBARAKI]